MRRWPAVVAAASVVIAAACSLDDTIVEPRPPTSPASIWTWQHPIPQGNDLNSVWARIDGVLFAVGDAGTLLRYENGVWELMDPPDDKFLFDVHGATPGRVFACGWGGTILEYIGDRWYVQETPVVDGLYGVWSSPLGFAYAVGVGGTILRFAGAWTEIPSPVTVTLNDVWGTSPSNVWIAGNDGHVLQWDGTDWTVHIVNAPRGMRYVWCSSADDVYVTAGNNAVYHYDGTDWSPVEDPAIEIGGQVWGRAADDVYMAGDDVYHYDGSQWTSVSPCGVSIRGMTGSGSDIWLVGQGGAMYRATPDGCEGYRDRVTGSDVAQVWGTAPDNIYAVTFNEVLHYNGTEWSLTDAPRFGSFRDITGRGPDDVQAVAYDRIQRYDGSDWYEEPVPGSGQLRAAWLADGDEAFAVDDNGRIFHRTGGAWALSDSLERGLRDVWGAAPEDVVVVGEDGLVARFDGVSWTRIDVPDAGNGWTVTCVWGTSGDDVYAGNGYVLWHWDGDEWTYAYETLMPAFGVWASEDGTVFVCATDGRIRRRDDSGWSEFRALTGHDLYDISGLGTGDVYAVGEYGTIIRYGN